MPIDTGEKTFDGILDSISFAKTKTDKDYAKIKVNGKTFNLFDKVYEYFKEHEESFKVGTGVNVVYRESSWGDGNISNNATALTYKPEYQQSTLNQQPAPESTPKPKVEIETMMRESIQSAAEITEGLQDLIAFTPENTTSIGISMFIEKCRRRGQ